MQKKERADFVYVPSFAVGTVLYQKGNIYGSIVDITEKKYIVDRSIMFPDKEPVAFAKKDFEQKFYKRMLEGLPAQEQVSMEIFS